MKRAFSPSLMALYIGNLVSNLGSSICMISLSVILARESSTALAAIWMIRVVVALTSKFFVGSIADRLGHKKVLITSDIVRCVLFCLIPLTLHSIWLFVLVALSNYLDFLFGAGYQPLQSTLTTVESRQQVNSIQSTIGTAASFIGPLLGGVLVLMSTALPFEVNGVSFLLSAGLLLLVRVPKRQADPTTSNLGENLTHHGDPDGAITAPQLEVTMRTKLANGLRILKEDVSSSWKYIMKNPILRVFTFTITIFGLSSAIDAYEVLFATKTLHLSASAYGLVVTIGTIAFFCSGMLNTLLAKRIPTYALYSIGTILVGGGSVLYACSINLLTLCIALVLVNIGIDTTFTASGTIEQTIVPVEIQGRISSAQGILPEVANTLSIVVAGILLAHAVPLRSIFLTVAIISLLSIPVSLIVRLHKGNLSDTWSDAALTSSKN